VLGYGNTEDIGDDETPASVGPVDLGAGRTAVDSTGGESHHCAILDNGTVKCWGFGNLGRLGYGNTEDIGDDETPASVGPVNLGAGRTAVSIAAGEAHNCAILDNGTVKCWGWAGYGGLGYGNKNDIGDNETPASVGPVDIGAGRTAVAITAGTAHSCALLDNGAVRCWGFNVYGQLGTGNTENVGDDETPGSVSPVNLGAGRTAVAISAGWSHTCALLDNGTVKCWGKGAGGRLGYGNTNDVTTPSAVGPVNLGAGRTAVAISATETHTCALLDNGTVRCWGENDFGQLGYGNSNDIGDNETPASVGPVDIGAGRHGVAISAGKYFTCVTMDTGTVRCWGEGAYGLLGNGDTTRIGDNETPGSGKPADLGNGHGALEAVAGGSHTCALFDLGTVRCWGNGADGRLGYGNTATIGDDESPGAVGPVELGERSAVQLAVGESHTCALLDDGTVICWGKGAYGQLGYGNTNDIGDDETPAEMAAVDLGGESAIAIAAGANHSCALTAIGAVRCWGLNSSGQLGYGNTLNIGDDETPGSVLPANVGQNAIGISAGANHTCARLVDGTLRCWGLGTSGRLGYANTNTIGDNETPSTAGAISVGRSATAIAAGGSHTCTRFDDGGVRCWGLNTHGQLGYGNTTTIGDNEAPSLVGTVDLGTGRSALRLSTGANHTCAALEDGTVRCWGLNSSGQLGYGNTENVGDDETPGSVGPLDFEDDPPTAVNDFATVSEDSGAVAVEVLANDTDPDGGTKLIEAKTNGAHGTVAITGGGTGLTYTPSANYCGPDSFTYTLNGGSTATVSIAVTCVEDEAAAPVGSPTSSGEGSTSDRSGPSTVVNVTPGVGILSGRHRPRVAIKGAFAFFTLTCRFTDRDCRGKVVVKASVPSVSLGVPTRKVTLVKGPFRIGARRSVLVRARLRRHGRRLIGTRRSLRGFRGRMAIIDARNGERGAVEVTLVRRPRASLLPGGKKNRTGRRSRAR
jgi:alpha-tubulin suppressor-like RCC1 family protein